MPATLSRLVQGLECVRDIVRLLITTLGYNRDNSFLEMKKPAELNVQQAFLVGAV